MPPHSPLSWNVYFTDKTEQGLQGTSLVSHWSMQLGWATAQQQMGAKTKLCPLHYVLWAALCGGDKNQHAGMWISSDRCTKSLWLSISPGSSDWPMMLVHDYKHAYITLLWCRILFAFELCGRKFHMARQWRFGACCLLCDWEAEAWRGR